MAPAIHKTYTQPGKASIALEAHGVPSPHNFLFAPHTRNVRRVHTSRKETVTPESLLAPKEVMRVIRRAGIVCAGLWHLLEVLCCVVRSADPGGCKGEPWLKCCSGCPMGLVELVVTRKK
jgi:hypothetical protein